MSRTQNGFTKIYLICFLSCCFFSLNISSVQAKDPVTNTPEEYLDEDDEINIDKKIKKMDLKRSEEVFETKASWYGGSFHGKKTAANEIFDANGLSAAHKTLPIGTHLLVTNKSNNRQVILRVNDRGPFIQGREIDVSETAAKILDFLRAGVANVSYEILKMKDQE